jgi:hypothetical protein
MSIHNDPRAITAGPVFGPAFWRIYEPQHAAAPDTQSAPSTRLGYSRAVHGSHEDFCRSEAYAQYRQEVVATLNFLAAFVKKNDPCQIVAERVRKNLGTFFHRRFNHPMDYRDRLELIDSVGKRLLDEFHVMVRNPAIGAATRVTAVVELAYGLTECADAVMSNLAGAVCSLAKASGGFHGKLWQLKEQVASNALRNLVAARFESQCGYERYEIHYFNTAWNEIADEFGLQKSPDQFRMDGVVNQAFRQDCVRALRNALTPIKLASLMADACVSRFMQALDIGPAATLRMDDAALYQRCIDALRWMCDDYGLASGEGGDGAEAELRLHSFLAMDADTGVAGPRPCGLLPTLDFLKAMHARALLDAAWPPERLGEWVDDDFRSGLFRYGKLTWLASTTRAAEFATPVWDTPRLHCDAITFKNLQAAAVGLPEAFRMLPAYARRRFALDNAAALIEFGLRQDRAAQLALALDVLASGRDEDTCRLVHGMCVVWGQDDAGSRRYAAELAQRKLYPDLHAILGRPNAGARARTWFMPLHQSGLLALATDRVMATPGRLADVHPDWLVDLDQLRKLLQQLDRRDAIDYFIRNLDAIDLLWRRSQDRPGSARAVSLDLLEDVMRRSMDVATVTAIRELCRRCDARGAPGGVPLAREVRRRAPRIDRELTARALWIR